MWRKIFRIGVVILVLVASAVVPRACLAQDGTPPADPGDLVSVLEWIASGVGVGFLFSILAEKSAWYEALGKKQKFAILVAGSVGLPVLATALLLNVPANVWTILQPYWRAAISGIYALVGSQVYYRAFVKPQEEKRDAD